ncbi:2-hydroxyacid dehydrogenase [Poseidonocella sedimentorum]|uniref:Glyoxylate/hydroxypyruvate reductase A n=1 Tax=Poseidonocella sedimentorum TaxID=871652 RepID=A0A1I6DXV3_9RHOB|nr:glyoxylate/hydroxypyruvate reductase A [Poseidonocella sedimentorum]SFR10360.1 glyoxylate/hydroxypyruvate reductase A [Poseidonocella sedimentorum]
MTNVLFAAETKLWPVYAPLLRAAFAETGLGGITLETDLPPEEVDYIVYSPGSTLQDFTPYTRCKAVLNLWAGVENVTRNATLTQPLARMVDPGMEQAMVEWVTGHTLRHHIGMDRYIHGLGGAWSRIIPPLAPDRPVTVLGLGALGSACARALAGLHFPVRGWSRSPKDIPGVTCFSGEDGLKAALEGAQIVSLLLPSTPGTRHIMTDETFALLAKGAVLLNSGRGALVDDEALLRALDSGQVSHATLDVFHVEPLPEEHPFWSHPGVTVTPHISSETRPPTASRVIAENVRRGEAEEPFLHLVDRAAGY